mmetsp:Transcript_36715/g.108271  ORF Transcript_36715/g.108271 Transcript_36715/m.108271 type:complete len:446 (-) Transcript_36715:145-1482(-)
MGCLSSKEAASGRYHYDERGEPSGPPPDFGVKERFEVKTLLGEGGSGQTWLCIDRKSGQASAVKFISRPIPKTVLPMLLPEIMIQAELGDGHVNLVSAQSVIVTDTHLGIVMEYAAGGTLTDYVQARWETSDLRGGLFLSEDEARYFFKQYISAVEYLHAHHVAHRDLKLDNVVLDGHTPPWVKVCDFGFAKRWDVQANMHTVIGTPVYMSPQLIASSATEQGYDASKADIWASAVLLFVMLLGQFPYDHTENVDPNCSAAQKEVLREQIRCAWHESPDAAEMIPKLSRDLCDLLDRMFERDEDERITIAEIKAHRWFNKPVAPSMQSALEHCVQTQAEVELQGRKNPIDPNRAIKLQELLEVASKRPPPLGQSPSRVREVPLTVQVNPCHALGNSGCRSSASGASAKSASPHSTPRMSPTRASPSSARRSKTGSANGDNPRSER